MNSQEVLCGVYCVVNYFWENRIIENKFVHVKHQMRQPPILTPLRLPCPTPPATSSPRLSLAYQSQKLSFKKMRYGRTDRWTDGQIKQRRYRPSYKDAWTHLKKVTLLRVGAGLTRNMICNKCWMDHDIHLCIQVACHKNSGLIDNGRHWNRS